MFVFLAPRAFAREVARGEFKADAVNLSEGFLCGFVESHTERESKVSKRWCKFGNTFSANHGLRLSHSRLRGLGWGSGKKRGRYSA